MSKPADAGKLCAKCGKTWKAGAHTSYDGQPGHHRFVPADAGKTIHEHKADPSNPEDLSGFYGDERLCPYCHPPKRDAKNPAAAPSETCPHGKWAGWQCDVCDPLPQPPAAAPAARCRCTCHPDDMPSYMPCNCDDPVVLCRQISGAGVPWMKKWHPCLLRATTLSLDGHYGDDGIRWEHKYPDASPANVADAPKERCDSHICIAQRRCILPMGHSEPHKIAPPAPRSGEECCEECKIGKCLVHPTPFRDPLRDNPRSRTHVADCDFFQNKGDCTCPPYKRRAAPGTTAPRSGEMGCLCSCPNPWRVTHPDEPANGRTAPGTTDSASEEYRWICDRCDLAWYGEEDAKRHSDTEGFAKCKGATIRRFKHAPGSARSQGEEEGK